MPSKKGIYPQGPVVPGKQVAGSNPVGSQTTVGGTAPPIVPPKAGAAHGFGPVTEERKQPRLKGEVKYGHFKLGKLRMSGHPEAHRIGSGSPFKGNKVFK